MATLVAIVSCPGAVVSQAGGGNGTIVGRVVDHTRGTPLAEAEIRVPGISRITTSDPLGRFALAAVPPGPQVLETRRMGYGARTDTLTVSPGETIEVVVGLGPDPLSLPPLVVAVRSRVLESAGFYGRRDQGLSGVFLTRQQIEERNPPRLSDLFIGIPGFRLQSRGGIRAPAVVSPRGNLLTGGVCFPVIWLDGVATTIVDLDDIHVNQVEGMEIYQGAGAPVRYNNPCGAILIWTRVPIRRDEP